MVILNSISSKMTTLPLFRERNGKQCRSSLREERTFVRNTAFAQVAAAQTIVSTLVFSANIAEESSFEKTGEAIVQRFGNAKMPRKRTAILVMQRLSKRRFCGRQWLLHGTVWSNSGTSFLNVKALSACLDRAFVRHPTPFPGEEGWLINQLFRLLVEGSDHTSDQTIGVIRILQCP